MTNQAIEELEVAKLLDRIGAGTPVKDISDPVDNVTLYHRETGEPRTFPRYMLAKTARKRLPGGGFMLSDEPEVEAVKGTVMCKLHADYPRRAEWDNIGLRGRTCPAAHLASDFDMEEHMRRKHRRETAVIEQYERRLREDEQAARAVETQELLRQQATAAMALVGQVPARAPREAKTYTCDECGFETSAAIGLTAHKRSHGGS